MSVCGIGRHRTVLCISYIVLTDTQMGYADDTHNVVISRHVDTRTNIHTWAFSFSISSNLYVFIFHFQGQNFRLRKWLLPTNPFLHTGSQCHCLKQMIEWRETCRFCDRLQCCTLLQHNLDVEFQITFRHHERLLHQSLPAVRSWW